MPIRRSRKKLLPQRRDQMVTLKSANLLRKKLRKRRLNNSATSKTRASRIKDVSTRRRERLSRKLRPRPLTRKRSSPRIAS